MNLNFLCRASRIAVIGAVLFCSAACISIDKDLGKNLIPTDQLWDVFLAEEYIESDGLILKSSDSLSAYSTRRFTFGSVDGPLGTMTKGTSFTLIPVIPHPDLGENPEVLQFHFSAVRDTISMVNDNLKNTIQNVYVYSLKHPLDSTAIYADSFSPGVKSKEEPAIDNRDYFVDFDGGYITAGIPTYNGSDSLAFDFSKEYAERVIAGIQAVRALPEASQDSIKNYINEVPGIYIEADAPVGGGRINMFDLALEFDSSGYVVGNYAELKIRTTYDGVQKDTSFLFIYGPSTYIDGSGTNVPTQYAFNTSSHTYLDTSKDYNKGIEAENEILVEGGCGIKPVVKAGVLKEMLHAMVDSKGISNHKEVVINKATIVFPYAVGGDYAQLDKYPTILSPTVRLRSTGATKYVSYAGLTDASIESENHGDINRSLDMYCPDISHHVQEILKQDVQAGDESDEDYAARIGKYDIWMLIMHEEVTVTTSAGGSNSDYYNNLLYNSYYNNMMYDPYGYGYGYGGYGYGYGGYGYNSYGYGSNYYNYMMMAAYANASSSTTSESVSTDLDKDRYYNGVLCGPNYSDENLRPRLKITFSAPKSAENR